MLTVKKNDLKKIIAHVKKDYHNEACGILAGENKQVSKIYQKANTDKSSLTYFMDPKEQFKIAKEMREQDLEMLGIYHSHIKSKAYPSERDIQLAFYSEATYFIVSLENFKEPDTKAFRIADGTIKSQDFKIKE